MKKCTFSLLLLATTLGLLSQDCLPAGINFSTQDQVDNFQANHPGCSNILGDVAITGNQITNLTGLNVLTSIGGDLRITFEGASLLGLDNLTSIGGMFRIANNSFLTSLEGLNSLASVGGDFDVDENESLKSLAGMENLGWVGEDISITTNPDLESLSSLDSLVSIGESITIFKNPSLKSINGFRNLTSAGGIGISWNAALTHLDAFHKLVSISGSLAFSQNQQLASLDSLSNLVSVGSASFFDVPDLSGLGNLQSVKYSLTIGTNIGLTSLDGLQNLNHVGNTLKLVNSPSLTSLSALSMLDSAIEELIIQNCPSLTSLHGLEKLDFIHKKLEIENCTALTSLSGLDNAAFTFVSLNQGQISSLKLIGNHSLAICNFPIVCNYLGAGGWNYIDDNQTGCFDYWQVMETCGLPVTNVEPAKEEISIFPNRAGEFLEIQGNLSDGAQLSILDCMGRLQRKEALLEGQQIDLLGIPGGVLFIQIRTKDWAISKRIVKLTLPYNRKSNIIKY
ncbi:MAG: T9SS type A sorting domain-containing protein [Bacteroidota bacterium]